MYSWTASGGIFESTGKTSSQMRVSRGPLTSSPRNFRRSWVFVKAMIVFR